MFNIHPTQKPHQLIICEYVKIRPLDESEQIIKWQKIMR